MATRRKKAVPKKRGTTEKTKKKTIKVEEVKPYASLTEEQFDNISSIVKWDNPMNDIESIIDNSDISIIEVGYKLGRLYSRFEEMFEKLEKIIDDIEPQTDEEDDDEFQDYFSDDDDN